jgi:mono/diheme cytochrome c family protein
MLLGGCWQDMADQPRYEPLAASDFFADGRAARDPPVGTVARGQLRLDEHLCFGKVNGKLVETFPLPVTQEQLDRGQQRFDIYCAACHDRVGNGRGMVVQRGFPPPPSYHIDRLRAAPVGHFFDVITNGFGRMPDYGDQIPPSDRWAIIAHIRALQLSQHAERDKLVPTDLRQLQD